MNSIKNRVITIILAVLLLAYVGYQVYQTIYDPYKSEIVNIGTYIDNTELDGFFVRNEKAIDAKNEGVISYRFSNAEKISKGTVIANIYKDESDIYNLKKIEDIQKKKALLEQVESEKNSGQLDVIIKQLDDSQLELIRSIDEKNLTSLDKNYDDIFLNINRYSTYLDKAIDVKATITELDAQIKEINSRISNTNISVKSADSGYFSSYVDGYEEVLTQDFMKKLTVESAQTQLENKTKNETNNIGKMIENPNWDFVSIVDSKEVEKFKEGQSVTLKFTSTSTKEINSVVSKIITEKGSDKSVIVFSGDYLDSDFTAMRFEKPIALNNSYYGIKIPKEAIRFQDGKKGVYTLLGKTVRFKYIEVIYEDKNILISKVNESAQYVCNHDNVIVKGKELNENAM